MYYDKILDNYSLKIETFLTRIFFTQPKPTSSVDFVNETTTKAVPPLLPLRTSPPRVIKRKAPIQPNIQSPTGNFFTEFKYA